jgi:aspartyl/asparaginyl beta-hydroxylase (cupin superfamily)
LSVTTPGEFAELAAAAAEALRAGEPARARALIEAGAGRGELGAPLWLMLAQACAALNDAPAQRQAIERALQRHPANVAALAMKGDCLAAAGDARAAATFYAAAMKAAAADPSPSQETKSFAQHARRAVELYKNNFEHFIRAELERAGYAQAQMPPRFARAVDILLGKRQAYVQQPRHFYYPELPQIQFYPRAEFGWLAEVEAAAPAIRAELLAILHEEGVFHPYVEADPNRPPSRQMGMVGNPDWSALFLRKNGALTEHAARCPATIAALKAAPLTEIPNRAPGILFSLLKAKAHIPAHTGMINARLICHLPLIVPPGCLFRVGNEVQQWVEDAAWVFDDTIEHEAWNNSVEDRYVLIFDVWRPELSQEERQAFVALLGAVDAFGPTTKWVD